MVRALRVRVGCLVCCALAAGLVPLLSSEAWGQSAPAELEPACPARPADVMTQDELVRELRALRQDAADMCAVVAHRLNSVAGGVRAVGELVDAVHADTSPLADKLTSVADRLDGLREDVAPVAPRLAALADRVGDPASPETGSVLGRLSALLDEARRGESPSNPVHVDDGQSAVGAAGGSPDDPAYVALEPQSKSWLESGFAAGRGDLWFLIGLASGMFVFLPLLRRLLA